MYVQLLQRRDGRTRGGGNERQMMKPKTFCMVSGDFVKGNRLYTYCKTSSKSELGMEFLGPT